MRKTVLFVIALTFMAAASAEEGGPGLFGRIASGATGMVEKTAGQSYGDAAEKHASEDPRKAAAIRLKAKAGADALKDRTPKKNHLKRRQQAAEKHASEDPMKAAAFRLKAKAGVDALKDMAPKKNHLRRRQQAKDSFNK